MADAPVSARSGLDPYFSGCPNAVREFIVGVVSFDIGGEKCTLLGWARRWYVSCRGTVMVLPARSFDQKPCGKPEDAPRFSCNSLFYMGQRCLAREMQAGSGRVLRGPRDLPRRDSLDSSDGSNNI